MRTALRKRYYCDHCNKAGGSSGHMKRHEATCTANPARQCRMCAAAGIGGTPLAELVTLVRAVGTLVFGSDHPSDDGYYSLDDAALAVLREKAAGCPVCMFAALRQAGAFANSFNAQTMKAECASLWANVNEETRYY